MSATNKRIITVDVTRGDCLEANRKAGKSNTGTYFICSTKEFAPFADCFDEAIMYKFDRQKIKEYQILFNSLFSGKLDDYNGHGQGFDTYCNFLISFQEDPAVHVGLRCNDLRVFMNLGNNSAPEVKAFRNLLYEDISSIQLEKTDYGFMVYPVITANILKIGKKNSELILDE